MTRRQCVVLNCIGLSFDIIQLINTPGMAKKKAEKKRKVKGRIK